MIKMLYILATSKTEGRKRVAEHLKTLSPKEKKEFWIRSMLDPYPKWIENFKDYWLGYCSVVGLPTHLNNHTSPITNFEIWTGLHKKGQLFNIDAKKIPYLIKTVKDCLQKRKRFYLKVYDGAWYQDYHFNLYQLKKLLPLLEDLEKRGICTEEDV